jgi:hypothetical protein
MSAYRVEIRLEHLLAVGTVQCQPVDGRGLGKRAAKALDLLERPSAVHGYRRQPGVARMRLQRRPLGQALARVARGDEAANQNFQTRFICSVSNEGVLVALSKSTQRMR